MSEDRKEKILRMVRLLIAKANGTDFPEEKATFMAKADELMEAYAIETWQLAEDDKSKARLIVGKEMDTTWWQQLRGVHHSAKSSIYWLFDECVRHCRCVTSVSLFGTRTQRVYGTEGDIAYLDLLFTDLFTQMFAKLKPTYDPKKSLGENVYTAKLAGMKYTDIAVWSGHPEWRVPNGTGGYKTADNGKMLREYKNHLKSIGLSPRDVISVHPDTYAINFVEAFTYEVKQRLRAMRETRETEKSSGMELALRDIALMAKEAMWEDYPDLKPHPADCECASCKKSRKPVRYKGGHSWNAEAQARGRQEGAKARIVGRDGGVGQGKKRELNQ